MNTTTHATEPRSEADQRDDDTAIRPFKVDVPQPDLADLHRRVADPLARAGDRRRRVAGRAARDHAGARAALGRRARLARGRGEDQRRSRTS